MDKDLLDSIALVITALLGGGFATKLLSRRGDTATANKIQAEAFAIHHENYIKQIESMRQDQLSMRGEISELRAYLKTLNSRFKIISRWIDKDLREFHESLNDEDRDRAPVEPDGWRD